MRKDYIRLVENVLSRPQKVFHTGNKEKWEKFEAENGIILPTDYKEFINIYGTGGIGDFLWFLNPFANDDNVNYLKRMNRMLDAYRISKNKFPEYYTFNLFPEENGLLPWGYTDNGDELYWCTNTNLDNWEIVIYESASPEFHKYKMSLSEFLYKIIKRDLICDVFPEELYNGNVEFVAVDVD